MRDLKVIVRALSELKPYPGNARKHSSKHIKQIAQSIETFGWTLPILVDDSGMIIAGHGRLEAAKLLGLSEVPTIALSDLTEAQVQAYGIADNRLAELVEWDDEILAQELKVLSDLDLDFELPVIGFELPEIDLLIQNSDAGDPDDDSADRVPAVYDRLPPVSQIGDLWILGSHLRLANSLYLSNPPAEMSCSLAAHPATLRNFTWGKHYGGLFELPVAA
jgi:ParB-like chromosome segregation protein Spo0J